MNECFPEPKSLGGRVNCARKADSKNATSVNTSKFAKTFDLANLKSDVEKLDIDKLKHVPNYFSDLKSKVDKLDFDKLVPVPVGLSKLRNVVKMMLSKKMYTMLRLVVLKTKYLVLLT